jgi:hypothetical protein
MSEEQTQNPCYCRNGLVHLSIFPTSENASYDLIDQDEGEVYARVPVRDPLRGSDLSKMVPDGLQVEFADCVVFNMSGKLVIGTPIDFDTAVVTERAEMSLEETMRRLVVVEMRKQAAQAQQQAQQQEAPAEPEEAPVIEPESATEPHQEPEEATDA